MQKRSDRYLDAIRPTAESDLLGDGRIRCGGGSGLNGLGGTLRIGELAPESPQIRHVLKISFPREHYLHFDRETNKGYRWPAFKHDRAAPTHYRSDNVEAQIGCLRAIPPSVDIDRLGLETEPGRKIAWTLQNYGAYQVEEVPWSRMMIVVEEGPDGYVASEFEKDFGYPMATTDKRSNPWFRDMIKLMPHLCIVSNNGPDTIGGGGEPLQPLAPPLDRAQ